MIAISPYAVSYTHLDVYKRQVYYDQISGPQSSIPLTGISRSQFLLGFGTEILFGDDLSIRLEYQNHQTNESGSDQSVQIGIKKQF